MGCVKIDQASNLTDNDLTVYIRNGQGTKRNFSSLAELTKIGKGSDRFKSGQDLLISQFSD